MNKTVFRTSMKLLCAVSLAACSNGAVSESNGALSASATARSFGVDRYVVDGDSATLLDKTGAVVGTLQVLEPSAISRVVELRFGASAAVYMNEVTRPESGYFRAPLPNRTREEAIQLDPALANMLASHGLAFEEVTPIANVLDRSAEASCYDLSWNPACTPCSDFGPNACWFESFTGGTAVHGKAYCNPVQCSVGWWDVVAKDRYCFDSSGCSNTALGFTGVCTVNDGCDPEY